jgi:hypothetical protein
MLQSQRQRRWGDNWVWDCLLDTKRSRGESNLPPPLADLARPSVI